MIDWRRVIEWPWFAYHVLTWAALTLGAYLSIGAFTWYVAAAWALLGGIGWEVYERYTERRHGVEEEYKWNRWIVDPMCDVAGGLLGWFLARQLAEWVR